MYDESSDPFDGMSPEDMIKQILPDKVFNDQMDAVVGRIRDRINQGGVKFVTPHMAVGVFVPSEDQDDPEPKINLMYREIEDIPSGPAEVEAFFMQTGSEMFEAEAGLPAFVFVVRPAIVKDGTVEEHDGEEFTVPGKEHKALVVTGITVDRRKAMTMMYVEQSSKDKNLFIEDEIRTGCDDKDADQTPSDAEDAFMVGFRDQLTHELFDGILSEHPELADQIRGSIKERLFGDMLKPDYDPEVSLKAGLTDLVATRLN